MNHEFDEIDLKMADRVTPDGFPSCWFWTIVHVTTVAGGTEKH